MDQLEVVEVSGELLVGPLIIIFDIQSDILQNVYKYSINR